MYCTTKRSLQLPQWNCRSHELAGPGSEPRGTFDHDHREPRLTRAGGQRRLERVGGLHGKYERVPTSPRDPSQIDAANTPRRRGLATHALVLPVLKDNMEHVDINVTSDRAPCAEMHNRRAVPVHAHNLARCCPSLRQPECNRRDVSHRADVEKVVAVALLPRFSQLVQLPRRVPGRRNKARP